MATQRVYRSEAIVLRAYDYGEADRILTLITPQSGKLRAIAKGVRKTKSRMSGHLDLFTRSSLFVARGRQLDIVTQAETIENFRSIREDLWRSSYAHYVAELLEGFSAEGLANIPVYSLAIQTFRKLGAARDCDLVVRAFEIQLLGVTGYRPQLHRCLGCGEEIEPDRNRFSAAMGGILCPNCSSLDRGAPAISVPALKALRNLQMNEDAMLKLPGLDREIQREIGARLNEYIVYRLESQPRSLAFIERLRAEHVVS
jgi:DNA repair protein RecO (recombination protein O)